MPKRCTLAGFQRLKIGSAFAVKRMLHSNAAVLYIFLWWLVILFLLSYWFRAVEITACQLPGIGGSERNPWCEKPGATEWTVGRSTFLKQNDYYMYTALWFMCVTSTSVGYGDVTPTTSIGRGIAAACSTRASRTPLPLSRASTTGPQQGKHANNYLLGEVRCSFP